MGWPGSPRKHGILAGYSSSVAFAGSQQNTMTDQNFTSTPIETFTLVISEKSVLTVR